LWILKKQEMIGCCDVTPDRILHQHLIFTGQLMYRALKAETQKYYTATVKMVFEYCKQCLNIQ